MAIVWVFILGFIMLGLIAGDNNSKSAKERAYKASHPEHRGEEEYISIFLTFFPYAFFEADKHNDPWEDARKQVSALRQKYGYPHSQKLGLRVIESERHDSPYGDILPNADKFTWIKFEDIYRARDAQGDIYNLSMANRFNQLADLYSSWFEDHPNWKYFQYSDSGSGSKKLDWLFKTYFSRGLRRHFPLEHVSGIKGLPPTAASADLFDCFRFVPEQAQAYFPEMRKMLNEYRVKHNIHPEDDFKPKNPMTEY